MEIESETERPASTKGGHKTLTSKYYYPSRKAKQHDTSQTLAGSKKVEDPGLQMLTPNRRKYLNEQKKCMEEKLTKFLSEIPHDVGRANTNGGRKRRSEDPQVIIKKAKQSSTTLTLVYKPKKSMITRQYKNECIQALIYYVEKNEVQDKQNLLEFILGESGNMSSSDYENLKKILRTGPVESLTEILLKETESMYFKLCHQSLLTLETVLRKRCETSITTIHSDVRKQFPRNKLCSSAVSDDLSLLSQGVQFKHKCTKKPDCNRFLQVVLRKRSVHCKLNPYNMFTTVEPQQGLTNVWSFAKLFMEPWSHAYTGFKDLDAYSLLTLVLNIRKPYANKIEVEPLQRRVRQVRDFSYKVLTTQNQTMTKKDKDQCLDNIIYILENGIRPKPRRAIKQINDFKKHKMPPLFDIILGIESKRKRRRQSLQVVRHRCWYRSARALEYFQPAVLPIVERNIRRLHRQTVKTFGPKPCARARSSDIEECGINEAKFKHKCPRGTSVVCQKLLTIIKRHTVETVNFFKMLQGSDPQTWLESPVDFLRIFLENSFRCKINEFEDCDITVLCQLIKRCIPLMKMFKDVQKQLSSVHNVRNKVMHKPNMNITHEEMEDTLAAIREFLEFIKPKNDTEEVAAAINDIKQLQAGNHQYFDIPHCLELLREVLNDTRMKYERKIDAARELFKNIQYMEGENTRLSSLENITEFTSPGDNDEENTEHGRTEQLSLGNDQHNLPLTSSEMGSMTMEGVSHSTENIQHEMAHGRTEPLSSGYDQHNLPSTSSEMGSMTMEGVSHPTENIQHEMAQGRTEPLSSDNEQLNLPSTSSEMGSMTMEGVSHPTENIHREMAKEIYKMSPDELRAALLKANEKDPRLMSEVLRRQSSS